MGSVETLIGPATGTLFLILFRIGVILFPGAIIGALLLFQRVDEDARSRLTTLLLFFPAIWLFVVVWGVLFAVKPSGTTINPPWVSAPIVVAPWLLLLSAIVFFVVQRGARLFALLYSVVNLYFLVALSLFAGMAISWTWL
jgi:hypothetical protein